MTTITLEHLRAALALADFDGRAAQAHMAPDARNLEYDNGRSDPPRRAGVLALVIPDDSGLAVVLTRRSDKLRGLHRGQISFPGGRHEHGDDSLVKTALRETCEELGLCDDDITVLGQLTPLYIPPSHHDVHPSVGYLTQKPQFRPNPDEVAEVFVFPLRDLLDGRFVQHEYHEYKGTRVKVPFYTVQGHRVWGATAIMLAELAQRLRAVLA